VNPVIYFHPEAYTTSGPKLMGRNAAGESFLRGFFTHSRAERFSAQVSQAQHALQFSEIAKRFRPAIPIRIFNRETLGDLEEVVYYPGPGIGEHAFHRALISHTQYSLCGITHTTSSAAAMDAIVGLLTAPVYPWDAVICTSTAVKDNVQRLLQAQVDFLRDRLKLQQVVLPKFPVIPLGIHCADFEHREADRVTSRSELGIAPDEIVVLFMGRLSFHAKAHPLAMYQALQKASQNSRKRVVLIECGWHANNHIQSAYTEAARVACPSVPIKILDGRLADQRALAWAAADIFCSLSDNIQETFGITPIEAMAAGLPVVVSDWDGYRDTVRDRIDGFRIPTAMPVAGLATDLAFRHALEIDTYDMYCGHTCSLVSVDIQKTVEAFTQLFQSDSLRAEMGASAKARAKENFDWSVIVPRYEALWTELNQIRSTKAGYDKRLAHPWPARMDPFESFSGYPTQQLTADTKVRLGRESAALAGEMLSELRSLSMVNFARFVFPTQAEATQVLNMLEAGEKTCGELLQPISQARRPYIFRSLAWLLKLGVIQISK
jgi:starch synthase